MKTIFGLIMGLPLAAAVATATSLLTVFVMGSLFVTILWISAGREQPA
jgi:hypothetical protein